MKYLTFMLLIIAVPTVACAGAAQSERDQWGGVRADTFASIVNGKSIISRVSPDFVNCGVEWSPGDKFPVDIDGIVTTMQKEVVKAFGKRWSYEHLSFDSYGKDKRMWVLQFFFQSNEGDTVVMVCNLKGAVWPHGKVYDEFDMRGESPSPGADAESHEPPGIGPK